MIHVTAADPHWGWWIVLYFFLGGIAAGAYVLATLLDLLGRDQNRGLIRIGYTFAFALITVCGLLLIVDLNQPTRFWHMLLKSEVVHTSLEQGWPFSLAGWKTIATAPLLKYWSPMSIGSWAITLFGLCSLLSLIAAWRPNGLTGRLLARRWLGYPLRLIGGAVGCFVAAYTGALLTATNQPIWSDSTWIGALFLCSAVSTGLATLMIFAPREVPVSTLRQLHRAEFRLLAIELLVFVVFLGSLGKLSWLLLQTNSGRVLLAGTLGLGLLLPLILHLTVGAPRRWLSVCAATCVLLGGFAMRWGLLALPPELHSLPEAADTKVHAIVHFGPESGRHRGGGHGADPRNYSQQVTPRSKATAP